MPPEPTYQGALGRREELRAGVLAALVLADPAVNASVLATARVKGVRWRNPTTSPWATRPSGRRRCGGS